MFYEQRFKFSYEKLYYNADIEWLKTYKFFFISRFSATNDCIYLLNTTDNYVYVYKYALSRVH